VVYINPIQLRKPLLRDANLGCCDAKTVQGFGCPRTYALDVLEKSVAILMTIVCLQAMMMPSLFAALDVIENMLRMS
jgi:hypothetical protein